MQKKKEEFYDSAILAKYDIDRLDFLASIISFEKLIMSIMWCIYGENISTRVDFHKGEFIMAFRF